jgi:hypothetical protein
MHNLDAIMEEHGEESQNEEAYDQLSDIRQVGLRAAISRML